MGGIGQAEEADAAHDRRGGSGIDTEQPGIGERVARQSLHDRPGQTQRGADDQAEQGTRHALAPDDVADLEAKFAQAKDAHPSWEGKKAIFLQNAVYDGNFIAYQDGLSTAFLTDLGFQIPHELDEFVGEGQAYVPLERIDVLDSADVLIWGRETDSDETALESVAGFDRVKAVAAGNSVYTGGELAGAIYFDSPLSLSYVVDTLVPLLEKTNLG